MHCSIERAEPPVSDGSDSDAGRGEQPLLHVSDLAGGSVGRHVRHFFPGLVVACGLIAAACWFFPHQPMLRGRGESTVQLSQLGTLLFEPVDGGVSRACRGASATDNSPLNFQLSSASDLTFCQWQCIKMETCQGVEYHPSNWRCELWTRPGGIQASAYFQAADCYRRVAKLEPVDGGDDRACRGANPNDNNPAHYVVHPHSVLDDCERQCIATPECRGIEYSFGRCEVWVRGEGIESSVALPGFKCFRVAQLATTVTATTTATATATSQTVTATFTASTTVSSLDAPPVDDPQPLELVFRAVDGGMNRACRGADANDNSQSYFQVFTVTGLEDRCRSAPGLTVSSCSSL